MKNTIILILLVTSFTNLYSSEKNIISYTDTIQEHYLVGFELAELAQNSYRDLGPSNWTLHFSEIMTNRKFFNIGWSILAFNVDLASEHIQDPSQAPFLSSDRDNLNGDMSVLRAGVDCELLNISLLPINNSYLFRIIPIVGFNIGHYAFNIENSILNESFEHSTITIGPKAALRFTIFDIIYFDYKNIDLLYFLMKNNDGVGNVGNTEIDLSDMTWGLQMTMNIGFILRF